jgi:hypothetical protein
MTARTCDGCGPFGSLGRRALNENADHLRHLVEHWWEAETGGRAWNALRERHGEPASPQERMFNPPEFKIGPESLSLTELADDVRRAERELTALELELG